MVIHFDRQLTVVPVCISRIQLHTIFSFFPYTAWAIPTRCVAPAGCCKAALNFLIKIAHLYIRVESLIQNIGKDTCL